MLYSYGFNMWNQSFPGKTHLMTLQWKITSAKTVSPLPITNSAVYAFFDALSQPTIDSFLNTSSEFTAAQFDSTAMGTDTFGVLVKMNGLDGINVGSTDTSIGQAASIEAMTASCYYSTNGGTAITQGVFGVSSLTASSNTTQIAVGANGDIGLRVVFGNSFDGITSGLISLNLYWSSK